MAPDLARAAAFYIAAIVDILIVGFLIIAHEHDSALKALLNRITGHHWLTKSVLTVALFPVLAALLYRLRGRQPSRLRRWSVVLLIVTLLLVAITLTDFTIKYLAR
jgi:hypothetical protein